MLRIWINQWIPCNNNFMVHRSGTTALELNFSTLSGPSVPQLSLLCWYPYPASSTQTHTCSLSKDIVLAQCNELLSAELNMNDLFLPWQTLSKAIDYVGTLLPLTLFLGLISWHFYFFFQTRWQYFSINFWLRSLLGNICHQWYLSQGTSSLPAGTISQHKSPARSSTMFLA